jgi:hypothetical protein
MSARTAHAPGPRPSSHASMLAACASARPRSASHSANTATARAEASRSCCMILRGRWRWGLGVARLRCGGAAPQAWGQSRPQCSKGHAVCRAQREHPVPAQAHARTDGAGAAPPPAASRPPAARARNARSACACSAAASRARVPCAWARASSSVRRSWGARRVRGVRAHWGRGARTCPQSALAPPPPRAPARPAHVLSGLGVRLRLERLVARHLRLQVAPARGHDLLRGEGPRDLSAREAALGRQAAAPAPAGAPPCHTSRSAGSGRPPWRRGGARGAGGGAGDGRGRRGLRCAARLSPSDFKGCGGVWRRACGAPKANALHYTPAPLWRAPGRAGGRAGGPKPRRPVLAPCVSRRPPCTHRPPPLACTHRRCRNHTPVM